MGGDWLGVFGWLAGVRFVERVARGLLWGELLMLIVSEWLMVVANAEGLFWGKLPMLIVSVKGS
jgi:hypothetical protein